MNHLIRTSRRRLGWALLAFVPAFFVACIIVRETDSILDLTDNELYMFILGAPALFSALSFAVLGMLAPATVAAPTAGTTPESKAQVNKPFAAQVVGLEWLNPLQRRDYPTEWQLLWTLGQVQPNKNDDMVKEYPEEFLRLQSIGGIATANDGEETFKGFFQKYTSEITLPFRQNYYSSEKYFYTVRADSKEKWRELAGIHVEFALPAGKLVGNEAIGFFRHTMMLMFGIGNKSFPTVWSRSTLPDMRITEGGPNAGFTSLAAGLDYLQAHPQESVWVMNWDAPSFPKDNQLNENMVLLVLAGPDFNTERAALAWIGYPASKPVTDFQAEKGMPTRAARAWTATLQAAAQNAGKIDTDIGYVIYDAHNATPDAGERIARLAHTLTTELIEFDFSKQAFNTPALLGDMGAGTALTNVALGIAYANHFGKNVLIAGTTDMDLPTAVVVTPPEKVRPIKPGEEWFRARGENNAYLPWWGIRHDTPDKVQGYSQ